MFLLYFIIHEFFEPMLLQMQGFFIDMNAICKVLNIGQPVLQIMTVLSFVSSFEKSHQGSEIGDKMIVKNCNKAKSPYTFILCVVSCLHSQLSRNLLFLLLLEPIPGGFFIYNVANTFRFLFLALIS